MKIRILHLEDNAIKHASIARLINNNINADIDWVKNVETGLEKIEENIEKSSAYDLAITDMHYPLNEYGEADCDAGEKFIEKVNSMGVKLPIIVCSSLNMKIPEAFGCVWYNDNRDWEDELLSLVKKIYMK